MKNKELFENQDYKVDPDPDNKDQAIVTILNEDFKDVQLTYGTVSFGNENENGTINCNFNYEIKKNPLNKNIEDKPFNDFLGEIISSMLLTKLNEMVVVDVNEQNREFDPKELDN
jgi:hypothetical protein